MEKIDWENVNEVLEHVLEIEPSKRQQFLSEQVTDDKVLAEVKMLLDLERESEGAFKKSALEFSGSFFEIAEEKKLIGQKVGAFKILRELGYGGMGAVYLAEREDGKFSQKVAVKLLKREMNTTVLRRRFQSEQEILASLEHNNIARLLDAGTTLEGIPYLVMEFVEGIRIDKFCAENELGLLERLKLFNKVCESVSYAHQKLVVHRDIKPSNIIVSKDGEPKLLDFGISKLVDDSGATTKTITKLGAMTPEYASPEQINGQSVSTATDIYSLGVVLFKVLTGTIPFHASGNSDSRLFREITDSQPMMPSEAALLDSAARRNGDRVNNVDGSSFPISQYSPSQLKGDLDNIILKALRKEPERRYRTVEQFSADIWRFIDGLPVTARPATFGYRARKFYTRNKIQVLAGVLVFLSLIVGMAVALWQANNSREQARIASAAQQKAESESARSKEEEERAKRITKFMEKIIAHANPAQYAEGFEARGEAKVVDVLNEMSGDIEHEFPGQPDIQAELHHKFAEIFTIRFNRKNDKLAMDKAAYHAQKAIELRKQYYGEKHELVAKDMYYLWASKANRAGNDQDELARLFAAAIQMMRDTNPDNVNLPFMLLDYSDYLRKKSKKGSFDAYYRNAKPKPGIERVALAKNYLEESLSKFRKHFPENHLSIKHVKCQLGIVQIKRREFAEAQKNFPFCRERENPEYPDFELEQNSKILEEGLRK